LKTITTTLPITDEQLTIQTYDWTGSCEARYVRVQADINPEAGGFLFTDEFVVK
jgi:hexosaminidase